MSKWAPDNEDGLHPYVVTTSEWAGAWKHKQIVYAASLKAAKAAYGWTQQHLVSKYVHRALVGEVDS